MPTCPQCGREFDASDQAAFCPECRLVSAATRPSPRTQISSYIRRFPATTALLAVNILVFLCMWANHVSPTSPTVDQLIRWGGNSGQQTLFQNQWWRLVTSAFVHVGAAHLIMNMWALWLLGTLAEAVLGTKLYVGVYLLCAIAGSLGSLVWNPLTPEAGASGALMGIVGALLSVLKFAHLPVPTAVLRSTTRSLVLGAALTLAIGVLPRIANAAHVGGLICGLFVGLLLSLSRRADYSLQRPLRRICLLIPLLVMVPIALLAKSRGEPWMHYERALDDLRSAHFPEAEREARLAQARLSRNDRVLAILTLALVYQDKNDEAAGYLRELSAREPNNAFATNMLAMIELKRGNAEGARDLLTKALPQQPGNADGQVYLGRALQALNDDNAAMQHYREALNSNPDLYDAQMAVGSIYEKHQQPKEAILFYLKAAQLNPQQIEPLQALARVYEAVGMNAEASKIKAEIQRREAPSQNRSR